MRIRVYFDVLVAAHAIMFTHTHTHRETQLTKMRFFDPFPLHCFLLFFLLPTLILNVSAQKRETSVFFFFFSILCDIVFTSPIFKKKKESTRQENGVLLL